MSSDILAIRARRVITPLQDLRDEEINVHLTMVIGQIVYQAD
jgi:hypothetical protein